MVLSLEFLPIYSKKIFIKNNFDFTLNFLKDAMSDVLKINLYFSQPLNSELTVIRKLSNSIWILTASNLVISIFFSATKHNMLKSLL